MHIEFNNCHRYMHNDLYRAIQYVMGEWIDEQYQVILSPNKNKERGPRTLPSPVEGNVLWGWNEDGTLPRYFTAEDVVNLSSVPQSFEEVEQRFEQIETNYVTKADLGSSAPSLGSGMVGFTSDETVRDKLISLDQEVVTLQGDVSTIQGDISTIQGDISQIEGDISSLQSDVSAIQGTLSDLSDAVDEANQNSAQALTAAEQAALDAANAEAAISGAISAVEGLQGFVEDVQDFMDASVFTGVGTGGVTRTYQAKMADIINSADYSSLQEALDAAAGKVLVIAPGTYVLTAALEVSSWTTIYAYGCTFKRSGSLNNMLRNKSDGVTGNYDAAKGITIYGGTWNSLDGTGNCTVIAFGHCDLIRLHNALIVNNNQWHHLELNACTQVVVDGCTFQGGYDTSYGNAEAIQLDEAINSGAFPWFGPYDNTVCKSIVIRNCFFTSVAAGVGTHSYTTNENHNNIIVDGCRFRNVYYAAVNGVDWSDAKIINNRVDTSGYGIIVRPGNRRNNDVLISGNTVYHAGYSSYTSETRGIQITGASDKSPLNVVISNNRVIGTGGTFGTHAIAADWCTYLTIQGNVVDSAGRAGIFAYGGDSINITGNVCRNTNLAGGGRESIRVGTEVAGQTNRVMVTGNIAGDMGIHSVNNSLITNNNVASVINISGTNSGTTVVNNLKNATYS